MSTNPKDEALKLIQKARTERTSWMMQLRAFVEGTAYDGRPDWFSDQRPLFERRPCIVYPVAKSAIMSNADLLLGEGRFPSLSTRTTWMSDDAIDEGAARDFGRFANAVAAQARLHAAAREVFFDGQATGSSLIVCGIRAGQLFLDTVDSEWCEPTLDREGQCTKLVIEYPYLETRKFGDTVVYTAKLFRRVIDDASDTTYVPIELGKKQLWTIDKEQTFEHGLGFCPVRWYAHMRGCTMIGRFDGHAIHENLLDEMEALDFALSMRHQAALLSGAPQWTEAGVKLGYNPAPGELPKVLAASSPKGGPTSEANPKHFGGYVDGRSPVVNARRKSPGTIWQYEDKDVVVKMHSLPGDALKGIDEHAKDVRAKLAESLGVVFIDPDTLPKGGTTSGKALKALKDRQLQRCDQYRSDFGDHFLLPAWAMLMRIAIAKGMPFPGVESASKVIGTFGSFWSWARPPLDLAWGSYDTPDPLEQTQKLQAAQAALDAKLATRRVAVTMVKGVLGVEDVDAYLEELEKETEANAAKAPVIAQPKPDIPPPPESSATALPDDGDESDENE